MPKVTVSVKYPKKSAAKLLELFSKIVAQHKLLGIASPLNNQSRIDMDEFEALINEAGSGRDESLKHRAESEALMQRSNSIIGIDKGQHIRTNGTLLNRMTAIRDRLRFHHNEAVEALSPYGFEVVVGIARPPKRKKKKK